MRWAVAILLDVSSFCIFESQTCFNLDCCYVCACITRQCIRVAGSFNCAWLLFFDRNCFLDSVLTLVFYLSAHIALPSPFPLLVLNCRGDSTAFERFSWSKSCNIDADDTLSAYTTEDHFPIEFHIFVFDWTGYRVCLCTPHNGSLKNLRIEQYSTRGYFVHACGMHWKIIRRWINLPEYANFDLPHAWSNV